MTFYEAALRVLEEAGAPLHSTDITKRAIDRGLLSHIGKTPELTMLSRLAAMAKRPRDRKILVTARDTFALTDWMLTEDAAALEVTGAVEPNPEEALPPYRPVERHPEARAEFLRAIGRQAERERKRRSDDDGRRKKFPPVSEVAFELLQECQGALGPVELIARLKAGDLVDEIGPQQLVAALAEENQRRVDQGRRPTFAAARSEGGELQLSVERLTEGGPSPVELQQAFCLAAGLPFEEGRVVLRGARAPSKSEAVPPASPEDQSLVQQAKHAVRDAKKAMARVLRRLLGELELGTLEKSCVRMLHGLHFRELKLARRSKDGPTLTGRRKDGSLELRYAVRLLKGSQPVDRRHVQDLRRDLAHHGAHVGLLLSAGEARGDARAEALAGGAPIFVWCGDALAEKFFEAQVGVTVTSVELYAINEGFFEQAKLDAEESQRRREERQKERSQRGGGEGGADDGEARPPSEEPRERSEPKTAPTLALESEPDDASGDERDDGPDDESGEPAESGEGSADGAASGEGRKRRRRRRRRRRGAARPEGARLEATSTSEGTEAGSAGAPLAPPALPTPPMPPTDSGGSGAPPTE